VSRCRLLWSYMCYRPNNNNNNNRTNTVVSGEVSLYYQTRVLYMAATHRGYAKERRTTQNHDTVPRSACFKTRRIFKPFWLHQRIDFRPVQIQSTSTNRREPVVAVFLFETVTQLVVLRQPPRYRLFFDTASFGELGMCREVAPIIVIDSPTEGEHLIACLKTIS